MADYTATIKLRADRQGLTGEFKLAEADVKKLNDELQRTKGAGDQGAAGLSNYKRQTREAAGGSKQLEGSTRSLTSQFTSLKGVLASLGIVAVGHQLGQMTRELYSQVAQVQNTRTMLQGLTASAREYNEVQNYLVATANRQNVKLTSLSQSYARLLVLQNSDLLSKAEGRDILEGMNDAAAELGATNVQLAQSMYGMTQGLSAGILRAEELNQVVEPLPGLLQRLDEAAGLPAGGFRKLVIDGQVTSDMFRETLVAALATFDGASERTADNLSARATRIGNLHLLLAAQLEQPVNDSIGALMESYEASLRDLNEVLPQLADIAGDITQVLLTLVGIRVAAYFLEIRAASIATGRGMTRLEVALLNATGGMSAATLASRALSASLAFVGGPVGVAILAGSALLALSDNADAAEKRTASLQAQVDALADSLLDLSVQDIDLKINAQEQIIAQYEGLKDNLKLPEVELGLGFSDVELGTQMVEYSRQLEEYNTAIQVAQMRLASLQDAKDQVNKRTEEETAAASKLSDEQQKLLDKYLPLQALERTYQAELAELNSIVASSTEETARKQSAIAALNEAYQEERRNLDGSKKAQEEAAKAREKTLDQINKLIGQYAPLQNATAEYHAQVRLLRQARGEELLSIENYELALVALQEEYRNTMDPAGALVQAMEEELRVMRLSDVEREFANRTRGMSAEQLAEQGDAIRALIVEMKNEQATLDQLEADQQYYAQTTRNMLEGIQRSWADFFEKILTTGKLTFKDLGQSILDTMRRTVAEMWSNDLMGAMKSAFTPGGGGAGSTPGAGAGSGMNLGSLTSVLGSGVSGMLNASILQTTAPVYEAGKLISEGSSALNFSLKNIGTNIASGIAGGAIGTALGEAVFGKKAESHWGAMIGGAIGSVVPVIGTFLGSLIGGGVDALFGGDGMKRSSIGFDTGRARTVRDDYYYGTETFASGLQVNKINRRGDQAAADAIIDKFGEIDKFITDLATAAGGRLDLSGGLSLQGVHADYGVDDGSFFGMRVGEGADTEADMNALMASFSRQLIGHIEGLNEDVKRVLSTATGDAESILQQFQEALKLDELLRSGSLDVLGDNLSLEFVQQMAAAAGGIENLTAATSFFSEAVADNNQVLESAAERLRGAVREQFEALNLQLSDFSSVAQFREYFDSVKNTLDAAQVIELVQAGNALAVLIDKEKELGEVRRAEQNEILQGLVDSYKSVSAQATSLAGSLQNDIFKVTGVNATDLRARMFSGTYQEQLDAIDQMRQLILGNYNEELQLAEQLHQEKVDQYKDQLAALKDIDDYIKGVMVGDLSPLTVGERLATAQQQFDDIYQRALGGDVQAAQEATKYFDQLAKLNQTANASSVEGVDTFYSNLAKLEEIRELLGTAQDPGTFTPADMAEQLVQQLRDLQGEVTRVQTSVGGSILAEMRNQTVTLQSLPAALAEALRGIMGQQFGGAGAGQAVNSAVSAGDINSFLSSGHIRGLNGQAKIDAIMERAFAKNVGSQQLADAIGWSQADVLAVAKKYGYGSFAVGTDFVERDQLANIHQGEIIFDRPRAAQLRDAVVKQVTEGGTGSGEAMQRLAAAVEAQTALLQALVAESRGMSAEQREAFERVAGEVSGAVDRLTRELEDQAA